MTEAQTQNEKYALRRLATKCGLEISFSQDRGRLLKTMADGQRVPVLAGQVPALRRYLDSLAAERV